MNGGFRPGSGRKKGSVPWNKGLHTGNNGNGFKKGEKPCNFGTKMPSVSEKMKGNKNGKGNKGKIVRPETIEKMRLAKLGKEASKETRLKCREAQFKFHFRNDPNYIPCEKDKRRKRLYVNGGFHTEAEWETLKAQYNWTCPCCKRVEPEIKLTRDHIIPISKGGSDNIENIQPLCTPCNNKKYTKVIKY